MGTERVWEYCEARGIPRIFVVSMMDKDHADFEGVYQQIKARLTESALPVEIPIGQGPAFSGIVNLFSERAHLFKQGTLTGEYDEADVPDEYKDKEGTWETRITSYNVCYTKLLRLLTEDVLAVIAERGLYGTEAKPFKHNATITLTDNVKDEQLMGMGDRGIMMSGGTLNLHRNNFV